MSPAAPGRFERVLRAAGRAAYTRVPASDVARVERAVLSRLAAGGEARQPMSWWMPAAGAAAALAVVAYVITGGSLPGSGGAIGSTGAGQDAATPGRAAVSGRPDLDLLPPSGSGIPAGARRVPLLDFERPGDLGAIRFGGDARPELTPGGFSGRMALRAPDGDGSLEITVPAACRLTAAAVSIRIRAPGDGVAGSLTAGLEDGTELTVAEDRPAGGDVWRQAVFALNPERVRAGGGVRWVRLAFTGHVPAKLDTMELWTTATEARR